MTAQVNGQDGNVYNLNKESGLDELSEVLEGLTAQVTAQVILFCREPKKSKEIMADIELKHEKTFKENYLNVLIEHDFIERTIPDKPNSRNQQYKLTKKSLNLLKKLGIK